MIAVVIPSKTQLYLSRLFDSMNQSEFGWFATGDVKLYVVDSGLNRPIPFHWRVYGNNLRIIPYDRPEFIFSRAVNLGIAAALEPSASRLVPDGILIMNDDTLVQSPNFFKNLALALRDPDLQGVGIFSPVITGGVGNREQSIRVPSPFKVLITHRTICFVAALVRSEVLIVDGLRLDERYTGYGWEDNDFCRQVRKPGWLCGVLSSVEVKHGSDETGIMHGTFGRGRTPTEMRSLFLEGQRIFLEKWGPNAVEEERAADLPFML